MSLNPPTASSPRLMARTRGLLLTPCAEWERIDREPATVGGLFKRFVLPLAAIGPLAVIFNAVVFSHGRPRAGWSLASILLGAVIAYGLSLVMTVVLALIINGLAPGFRGCKNRVQAFKLAAYAAVAAWVAGVFGALPWLGPLILVGAAYSVYLLYLGLPRLMRAPADRALAYTAMTVSATLAIGALAFVALGSVAAAVSSIQDDGPALFSGRAGLSNAAQLAALAKEADLARDQLKAARGGASAPLQALPPERLRAVLPTTLLGMTRGALKGERRALAGYSASRATAVYQKGPTRITLGLSDLANASLIAAVAGQLEGSRSKTSESGYQTYGLIDGRPTALRFDRRSGHGQYMTLVGDRFLVEADGDHVTMDQLKSAAGGLNLDGLQAPGPAG